MSHTNKRQPMGTGHGESSGANSDRHKELDGAKARAAGRDTGSYPGEEERRNAGVLHDDQGGAADPTGGMAGSPRQVRGAMRDEGPVGGAGGSREGGESTGGEGEGGGGGGALPSSRLLDVGAAKKRAKKKH